MTCGLGVFLPHLRGREVRLVTYVTTVSLMWTCRVGPSLGPWLCRRKRHLFCQNESSLSARHRPGWMVILADALSGPHLLYARLPRR